MPNTPSAKKRLRQNARQRLRNKSVKSELRTLLRRFEGSVEERRADEAREIYPQLIAKLDRASQRRIIHPNRVARRKSKLTRQLQSITS